MEFLPKDVYEYLTQFGEDKDILNMLKVNKNFNKIINDNFFERVMRRKYPLLIKFKVDDQTWKDFYLSMVKYISKLEEEFGIPYIPNKDYNPKAFYNHYNKARYIYDKAMDLAALGGHMEIVKLMIEKGATDFKNATVYAARGGHMEIVKLLIDKEDASFNFPTDEGEYNLAMDYAVKGGHMEIANYLKKYIK